MAQNFVDAIISASSKKAINSLTSLTGATKKTRSEIMALTGVVGKLSKELIKTTNASDKYTTSLRLLNTVLDDTTGQTTSFVDKLTEMTGLDETGLTNQIAKFSQLGESLNLSDQYAEQFAEDLTLLTTKLSMLYNTDYSTMATRVQRAIQGTQTSLKSLTGIYATETAQQAILTENGINRQVSSLNDSEQAILRYAAILRQVTNDTSVYQDAVNSLAWQKQILRAQVVRLSTAIGQLLTPVLTKVYTVLNGVLMAITAIIKWIATLVGITVDVSKTTTSASGGFGSLGKSIKTASDNAKRSLRSFDKLNNITTPTPSGSGADGGLGIDPNILGLLGGANRQMLDIENNATKVRNAILEWLGFTMDENGQLKLTKLTFGGVLTTALLVLGAIKTISKIWSTLAKLKLLPGLEALSFEGIIKSLGLIAKKVGGISLIIWGIVEVINAIIDINKNGWNLNNVLKIIRGIALAVARSCIINRWTCWMGCSCNSSFSGNINIYN